MIKLSVLEQNQMKQNDKSVVLKTNSTPTKWGKDFT